MPKKVLIYTTPVCVYCRMVKSFFNARGISYEERDVMENERTRAEMFEKSGSTVVPVIDVDGEIFVGYHRDALMELFREA
ncbi:MAG: glutaredoxin family protein [Candidatus Liptonbacteria bacterium]|nr:glutaredoxin family protein [Candidatus Liptonbacteria bacterium]